MTDELRPHLKASERVAQGIATEADRYRAERAARATGISIDDNQPKPKGPAQTDIEHIVSTAAPVAPAEPAPADGRKAWERDDGHGK